MDLRQIRYFLTVTFETTFSRAAAKLHMTQPPLSTSIANLERELGVSLLERTSHGVKPTVAGKYLVEAGTRLLQEVDEMERHLRGIGEGTEGRLSIAAVPLFISQFMPELLLAFTKQSPQVDVRLSDPRPDAVIDSVLGGAADIGIVFTTNVEKLREQYSNELHVRASFQLPLVAMLPMRYENHADPIDLSLLKDEPWIVPTPAPRFPGLPELIDDLWLELDGSRPAVREVSTLQTAVPLIAADLGVSLMPRPTQEFGHPGIVIREVQQQVEPLHAAIIWRAGSSPSPVAQRFVDLIDSTFPPQ